MSLPKRPRLRHDVPSWVADGACFFVTVCAAPRGANQLVTIVNGVRILESVEHYHREGAWWVHLFLLMPDHAHALISVSPGRILSNTVRAWKSWQTKRLGVQWQTGFFDHRLRSDESHDEKANYIRENPVRAGLVGKAEEWKYVWSPAAHPEGSPYPQ
jgi:putative transposase